MLGFGPSAVDNLAKPWREMQCHRFRSGLLARKARPCRQLFSTVHECTSRSISVALRCSYDTFCFGGQSGTEPYSSTTWNRAGVDPWSSIHWEISVRESKSTMWYDFPN